MWRAYSGATGVALVMNNSAFLAESTALKAYSSPVAYLDDKGFTKEFDKVRSAIEAEAEFLRTLDRQLIFNTAFRVLMFAALCTKHPSFAEEKEWRVIYCPSLEKSDYLIRDIQAISGAPQPIFKIPLKDVPTEGLVGVEIPALIERVIIGPTQYPMAMWKAFTALLTDAGVENAGTKVFVSSRRATSQTDAPGASASGEIPNKRGGPPQQAELLSKLAWDALTHRADFSPRITSVVIQSPSWRPHRINSPTT